MVSSHIFLVYLCHKLFDILLCCVSDLLFLIIVHSALLLVDGVSSIGALPFKMDEWRVDVAITGSQKALCLPTGLGIACVSPKAHAAMKTATLPRIFFSYEDHDKTNAQVCH